MPGIIFAIAKHITGRSIAAYLHNVGGDTRCNLADKSEPAARLAKHCRQQNWSCIYDQQAVI